MNDAKRQWEKRSKIFKDTLKGVMFSSFPDSINKAFHNWELSILKEYFPNNKKINVLDVGCGYGRLTVSLAKEISGAKFYGIDSCKEYVKLYNKSLGKKGKAILASIDNWPFKGHKFDFIFIVTLLMYLSSEQIKNLLREIKKNSTKDTIIVVIENNNSGVNYITGLGLLSFIKRILSRENVYDIKSRVFKGREIENYFRSNYVLFNKIRCSLLTFILPLFLLFKKNINLPKFGFNSFLPRTTTLRSSKRRFNADTRSEVSNIPTIRSWVRGLPLPSLYIAYIFKVR